MIVDVTSERRPRLYLDQFALYEFASRPNVRDRFLARFATHGELMFSHVNMMEVGALRGRSAELVRAFLTRIGIHWVPIEYDFETVVLAENERASGAPHPALSERLLRFVYESRKPGSPITLDAILDEFASEDPERHRKFIAEVKQAMATNVAIWQDRGKEAFPVIKHAGPTLHVLTALVRLLVEERKSYRWTANDAFDFGHALVPLAYADALFLDKQWKERIERLKLDGPFATVFYGYEIGAFLDWFESYD